MHLLLSLTPAMTLARILPSFVQGSICLPPCHPGNGGPQRYSKMGALGLMKIVRVLSLSSIFQCLILFLSLESALYIPLRVSCCQSRVSLFQSARSCLSTSVGARTCAHRHLTRHKLEVTLDDQEFCFSVREFITAYERHELPNSFYYEISHKISYVSVCACLNSRPLDCHNISSSINSTGLVQT